MKDAEIEAMAVDCSGERAVGLKRRWV